MILLKETQGDSLQGAIDGVNRTYVVSYDFDQNTVNVYVNGRLKVRDWADGFATFPPRTVLLNEALEVGDSLEIEYNGNASTGGGALGGVPAAPTLTTLTPTVQASQPTPATSATNLAPGQSVSASVQTPTVLLSSMKPAIVSSSSS